MMKSEEKQLVKFDKLLLIENELAKTKVWKFFKCLTFLPFPIFVFAFELSSLWKWKKRKKKYIGWICQQS